MSIQKLKGGGFRIRYYANGRKSGTQRQETLRGVTFEEAKRIHRQRVAEASSKRARGQSGERLTFEQLANDYLELHGPKMAPASLERAKAAVRRTLLPTFGTMRLEAIRPIDIERYQKKRLADGVSRSTVNREWNTLRAILNFATKYGQSNPIQRKAVQSLKVDDSKLIYFTPEEWKAFVTAFDDESRWRAHVANVRTFGPTRAAGANEVLRQFGTGRHPDSEATRDYLERLRAFPPIFTALLYTGARLNDVLSLTWDDVDLQRGTVTIAQGKRNGKRVTVPIAAPLRRILEALPRGIAKVHVFRRYDGERFSDRALQRAFRVARKISGVRAELTPHSLRHTFASWLVMQGTPLRTVQELLGHADIRMTIRYAHLSPAHLAQAVSAIETLGDVSAPPAKDARSSR
jgi:integrase